MIKKLFTLLAVLLLLMACQKGEEKETPYADKLLGSITQGRIDKTKTDMKALGVALSSYLIDNNTLPETMHINELASRLQPAYIVLAPTTDGWGRKMVYSSGGSSYQLFSYGEDGKQDTADDIVFSDGKFIQLPKELGQ